MTNASRHLQSQAEILVIWQASPCRPNGGRMARRRSISELPLRRPSTGTTKDSRSQVVDCDVAPGCETGLALTPEWWPVARSVQPFQAALPKCSTAGR